MALIPGGRVNGKFKTFLEMTDEEIEQVVIQSEIRKIIIIACTIVFVTVISLVIKFC